MAKKEPVKKKESKVSAPVPPIFVNGMTQEDAIAYIGAVINQHKGASAMKHWTEEDLYVRHQLILNWLSQGMPYMDVYRRIRNYWSVANSTAGLYIKEAMKFLTSCSDEYRDNLRDTQIAKLEQWAEECRLTGKYMEASKFTDQLNKLYGLYIDNKKLEISSDGPIKVEFGE